MFLVQSKTSDGRLFYSYITGHEARLAKNWVSVQASLPHALSFQGLPTMSFSADAGNFTRARWTTAKVLLTKVKTDTHVDLGDGQAGNLYTQAQWVRSVQVILQDNPQYTASGFDAEYRPNLDLELIRPRPTVFKWTPGTLIQLLPIVGYNHPPVADHPLAVINLTEDKDDEDRGEGQGGPTPKKARMERTRRNTAA